MDRKLTSVDVYMFSQESPDLPPSISPEQIGQSNGKKSNRKLYALLAGVAIVIVVGVILATQGNLAPQTQNPTDYGSSMPLGLNYAVGERMTYDTTNIITNQMANTSLPLSAITNSQSYNSTLTLHVISETNQEYKIDQKMSMDPNLIPNLPSITLNVSKASYYNNFIAPGAPLIFYNTSSNPTISAYLAQQTVKVGDVWTIPVNTGNSSLGLTGEVTLKFVGTQDLTVPAGTYKTMKIEITSNTLNLHSDGTSIIKILDGMTIQLNGSTYIEQGTCRLIKADLTQATTTNSLGIGSTTTIYTEKTIVENTKP